MCVDTSDIARSNSCKRADVLVIGKKRGRVLVNPLKERSSSEEITKGKSILVYSRAVSVLAHSPKVAIPD
jgi:hypothetical protein